MTSSSLPPSISSASVRNILALLASRDAQLVAGSGGLERRVTWACSMRARLPAFESLQGGELALLALSQLRRLDVTLPSLLKTLQKAGVAAVAVAAPSSDALGDEAISIAEHLHLPLILLPTSLTLEEIAREMITFVVSFRGETERKATEIAHSLIGSESDFDYLERIILGQVAPILALEFARERERSEVESRYQVEAFTDVLQGHYQQPEEMLARARILGYDLVPSQVVVIFEVSPGELDHQNGGPPIQWSKRVRDELLRDWPTCWLLSELRRVIALLPLQDTDGILHDEHESENNVFSRLERVHARMISARGSNSSFPLYSCGIGRIAKNLQSIPQSFREAQQALEIGRRLFGEGKLHSFAHLGIYRLLFYLDGQDELNDFYQETLGPLLAHDARNDGTLVETLEGFFRCNGNLSETARAMHLHRNSLLYRLDRIEAILGRPLEDSELRLSLPIALKIHHLQKR